MELKATRFGYGEAVVECGKTNNNIVVLSADVTGSTASNLFQKAFPTRFFNVGVAEQNMAGIAAGCALMGKIPFMAAYSIFVTGRAWDQLRNTICYSNLNVKLVGTHSGLMVGPDGASHQALEDIAITRVIPHLKVIVPCDYKEAYKATVALSKDMGPAYLRLGREPVPIFTDDTTPFVIGKMNMLRDGNNATIVACGTMVWEALEAAHILKHENIKVRVLNAHTIKPIDRDALTAAAHDTGAIVTAEEHQLAGGLGSAVSEVLAQTCAVPMEMIAVNDRFGESGEARELMHAYGLTKEAIVEAVKKVIQRKSKITNIAS